MGGKKREITKIQLAPFTSEGKGRMVTRKMAEPNLKIIAEHFSGILQELRADLESDGMKETPLRAAKALVETKERSRMGIDQLTKMFKAERRVAAAESLVIPGSND
jgi:GTP cyclohydrolase I